MARSSQPVPSLAGDGASKELPHQQRLRDIIGWQIGDGSEEVMKLLIARSRFGRESFDPPMRHETQGR